MIRPLLGIVVATTQNDDKKHMEYGRPVLLALHQASRLFQWNPFLFLVNPTGATRYVCREDGKWDRHTSEPSAVAAHSMRDEFRSSDRARLLLVHLGAEERYIHPGLLPWVALFGDGSDVLSQPPKPIRCMLTSLLQDDGPVVISASRESNSTNGAVAQAWLNLMRELEH